MISTTKSLFLFFVLSLVPKTAVFVLATHDDPITVECPDVPSNGCAVCGAGQCVSRPDATLAFPGHTPIRCSDSEMAGLNGDINATIVGSDLIAQSVSNGIRVSLLNSTYSLLSFLIFGVVQVS